MLQREPRVYLRIQYTEPCICEYKPLCGVTPDKQEQDVSLTW